MTTKQEMLYDLSEKTTESICKILKIECWEKDQDNTERFTEEAQAIFNDLVDLTDNY